MSRNQWSLRPLLAPHASNFVNKSWEKEGKQNGTQAAWTHPRNVQLKDLPGETQDEEEEVAVEIFTGVLVVEELRVVSKGESYVWRQRPWDWRRAPATKVGNSSGGHKGALAWTQLKSHGGNYLPCWWRQSVRSCVYVGVYECVFYFTALLSLEAPLGFMAEWVIASLL